MAHFSLYIIPGLVGAPACGDVMKLQIEVDSDGIIVDAKFKTFGCGSAIGNVLQNLEVYHSLPFSLQLCSIKINPHIILITKASSSFATEWLKGKAVDECMTIKVLYLAFYYLHKLP